MYSKKRFSSNKKIEVNICSDPARLIMKAFDIGNNVKRERIFCIVEDLYKGKTTTDDVINMIEEILD